MPPYLYSPAPQYSRGTGKTSLDIDMIWLWCFAISFSLHHRLFVAGAKCVFPDGTPSGDIPCGTTGDATCCADGYACLSNNMCMLTEHAPGRSDPNLPQYARGSCTDSTWRSKSCPQFCRSAEDSDNLSDAVGVVNCNTADGGAPGGRWLCLNTNTTNQADPCGNSEFYFEFNGELDSNGKTRQ